MSMTETLSVPDTGAAAERSVRPMDLPRIERAVADFAKSIPPGVRVLDAGEDVKIGEDLRAPVEVPDESAARAVRALDENEAAAELLHHF